MLMIGTPCYGGQVTIQYMLAMLRLKDVLGAAGIPLRLVTPANDSLVTRARNRIANACLADPDCSHLLFIDADLDFPAALVPHLLAAGKDVVCGVYPVKGLDLGRVLAQGPDTAPETAEAASLDYAVRLKPGCRVDGQGFVEVEYAATGFMLLRREVLARLAAAYPQLRYRRDCTNNPPGEHYAFFDTAIDAATGDYLPEDYAFCKRWRDLGGAVHAFVGARLSHVGSRSYAGDFATFLARSGRRRPS